MKKKAPEKKKERNKSKLDKLCEIFRKRVRKDWDLAIAITGEEGIGKSTAGIQIARRVDTDFELDRNILFSPTKKEMQQKIREDLPKYSVLDADEAMKILYKLDWQKDIQKKLNKIYALCRKENLVSIFCIPRFKDLNEYFRNHRIKVWIHVIERRENYARAVVMFKDTNPVHEDPWHLKKLKKASKNEKKYKSNIFSSLSEKEQIRFFKKSPSFYDVITFKPLPKTMREKYEELRDSEKYKGLVEDAKMNKHEKLWRKRCVRTYHILLKLFDDLPKKYVKMIVAEKMNTINSVVSEPEYKNLDIDWEYLKPVAEEIIKKEPPVRENAEKLLEEIED